MSQKSVALVVPVWKEGLPPGDEYSLRHLN